MTKMTSKCHQNDAQVINLVGSEGLRLSWEPGGNAGKQPGGEAEPKGREAPSPAPPLWRRLAEACWERSSNRPTFEQLEVVFRSVAQKISLLEDTALADDLVPAVETQQA